MAVTINADNGAVSGSAGLKQAADSTGVLALQTNGTTAVSISTGQVVSLTNALPVASGGTSASAARTSLGLVIGTDVLAPSGSGASLTALNASNISSGTLARARLPAGTVLQVVNVQTGAYSSTTAQIPLDTTIPQNTEGTELFTVAITPTSSTSKLLIQVNVMFCVTASQWCTIALFKDSTANALAAVPAYINIATAGITTSMQYFMTAGTTSATTFKLRYGQPSAGATIGINGPTAGAAFFGGVCISGMTIKEIAV